MATVVFKPTEACNSRCSYCDVVRKKPRGPVTMPEDILELFFVRVNEFLVERPQERIEIIWHGGEPLLLGPEYLERAYGFQQKHCSETGLRIHHTIQSNLTLFSPAFTEVFKKLGIDSIGTSYEPIAGVRGFGKKRDWQTYNRQFMRGLSLLEKEGFRWGVIYVVTRRSLERPLDIFHFLVNLVRRGAIMFNPVLIYGRDLDHLKITPEEYADFLGAIFPAWWAQRQELPQIQPFFNLAANLLEGNRRLMCGDAGECANSHIALMPDGTLSHCGRSADWGLLNYGSIFDKSFAEVMEDPQRETLLQRNEILPENECKDCSYWNICHGGCPLDAWSHDGSYLHRSGWCRSKKDFIEKYFEPTVHPWEGKEGERLRGSRSSGPGARVPRKVPAGQVESIDLKQRDGGRLWINPVGGLGDTLMISGVLHQFSQKYPERPFNLVARTKYRSILEGHPAIRRIGHPPPQARLVSTNYWMHEDYHRPGARPYQILAKIFGLKPPVEERLYVPWEYEENQVLIDRIPWKKSNVLISPSSDSPRKQMGIRNWETLVEALKTDGIEIVQAGRMKEPYVRGSYSLLGLTTPRQLISLLPRFDVVITLDNFVMHAAHLRQVPAVVLWGPTDSQVYGYPEQIHLQGKGDCDHADGCLGPGRGNLYATGCPKGTRHCMDAIGLETIIRAVMQCLEKGSGVHRPLPGAHHGGRRKGLEVYREGGGTEL